MSTRLGSDGFELCHNAKFSKVGGIASKEVTFKLLRCKCIPVLIYSLESFSLPKIAMKSLDFAVTRLLMKLYKTSNTEIIAE